MASKPSPVCDNALLKTMSPDALAALEPLIEYVDMPLKKLFSKGAKAIKNVFFPCSGMFSLIRTLEDGSTIEVGLIGNEGFVGVPLLLGARASSLDALVQGAGTAISMPAAVLLNLTESNRSFRDRLLLYAQCFHVQVSQTAVCNARHTVPQRLARWILETHDRMGQPELSLSHEFLSYMLGVRRAGITVALQQFTAKGLVTTGRSKVTVRSRAGIEKAACECYRTVRRETQRLMAYEAIAV